MDRELDASLLMLGVDTGQAEKSVLASLLKLRIREMGCWYGNGSSGLSGFNLMNRALLVILFVSSSILTVPNSYAQGAQGIYSEYQARIFQIRLIELASGSKAAIGSGFQVSSDGLVATNYHVVSDAVYEPEKYRIEFIDTSGRSGELELLEIDVIHDLALVRHKDSQRDSFLVLSDQSVQQGVELYSIGNPRDLGMTVVNGTYNGMLEHSFYDRILFSGSINPGMSGGPTLNNKGEVVGINVATAGNQLSFLVPVKQLTQLMTKHERTTEQSFQERIRRQLQKNQAEQFTALLASDWPLVALGDVRVVGELEKYTRCWGGSSDEGKALYSIYYTRCFSEDNVYLKNDFSTGIINYEFYWLESEQLNSWQFYTRYQNSLIGAEPVNNVSEKHVTNFQCHNDFVIGKDDSRHWKAVLCAREYRDYPGIYDLLYIAAYVSEHNKGLISHFVLSGVSQSTGQLFARKFMEHIEWK